MARRGRPWIWVHIVLSAAAAVWLLSDYPWYTRGIAVAAVIAVGARLALRLKVASNQGVEPAGILPALRAAWQHGLTLFEAWVLITVERNGHLDVISGTKGDRAIQTLTDAGLVIVDTHSAAGYRARRAR